MTGIQERSHSENWVQNDKNQTTDKIPARGVSS